MIEENVAGCEIVILGFWNANIFTPKWIADTGLTDEKQIEVEFAINNPNLPLRLHFNEIYLSISNKKLILTPQQSKNDQLKEIEKIAVQILTILPHTPIQAVGVNFQYIEREATKDKYAIFDLSDNNRLSDSHLGIKETFIRRCTISNGAIINFTISLKEDKSIVYDFNFHKDLSKANEAAEYMDDNVLNLKEKALSILRDVYGHELLDEED